jgi:excisionase family DNA binding protein
MGDPEWLSTAQAAEWLGIVPPTLYRLIGAGELRVRRQGRLLKVKLSDLEEYVARHRIEPGSIANLYPGGREAAERRVRGRPG